MWYNIIIKYEEKLMNKDSIGNFIKVISICTLSAVFSAIINGLGVGKENTLMVLLVGVLLVSTVTRGYVYSTIAAVINVMLFNYLFTQPVHSLAISNTKDIVLMAFFLTASLISSTITSKLQYQTEISKSNERTAKLLYEITKGFFNVTGNENIILKGISYIKEYTGYDCYIQLDNDTEIYSNDGIPDYEEIKKEHILLIPIKGVAKKRGEVQIANVNSQMSREHDMIVKTIVHQMAIVLDREFIYEERQKIKIDIEGERLKSTLLRSISHDIRTPLTAIKGASELILDSYESLGEETVKKLAADIYEESTLLVMTVQNILDMTRISEGRLNIARNFEAVDDIVNQTLTMVPHMTAPERLSVYVPDDIVLLNVDGRLIVQVLVNLLDNAYKHAGDGAHVDFRAYREENSFVFKISDNGKGIEPSVIDKIFDGFVTYQSNNIADGSLGVGLGLTICKEIVSAHGGKISAGNTEGGGAEFKVMLPLEDE